MTFFTPDPQHQTHGKHAEQAGREEGPQVLPQPGTHRTMDGTMAIQSRP
ncbi:hypothetical protein [Geobacter sp. FeAm09]|nr:hypothetical protein [Geobacter sp. FeAm09]